MLSGEATNSCTNFIVFGLTRSGLKSTIYNTRGEHANHYTTDGVKKEDKTLESYFTFNENMYMSLNYISELKIRRFDFSSDIQN